VALVVARRPPPGKKVGRLQKTLDPSTWGERLTKSLLRATAQMDAVHHASTVQPERPEAITKNPLAARPLLARLECRNAPSCRMFLPHWYAQRVVDEDSIQQTTTGDSDLGKSRFTIGHGGICAAYRFHLPKNSVRVN